MLSLCNWLKFVSHFYSLKSVHNKNQAIKPTQKKKKASNWRQVFVAFTSSFPPEKNL